MESFFPQAPVPPKSDLRMQLRNHIGRRALAYIEAAAQRRRSAIQSARIQAYRESIRDAVRRSHRDLPVGPDASPPRPRLAGILEKSGYRIENVLFDSFPGWEVNANVYIPTDHEPPFFPIVVPVGHSGKQFESYQLPCQFFARSGFLAIVFDPPGQLSEKQTGNDHFRDGVRAYPIGESSHRYFVADALRCIDYLETRDDVDLSRGVAMTGVSGGGTTTIFSNLLDERIAVSAPSCCLSPLADGAIRQCLAACPEGRMWGRFPDGLDFIDLICAASPKPVLIMAGRGDEVFRIEDTARLADEVRDFYAASGQEDRCSFFIDESGHAYTLAQAARFVDFLDRWFLPDPPEKRLHPDFDSFAMNPPEELLGRPSQDVHMRSLSGMRAQQLERERENSKHDLREAARAFLGISEDSAPSAPFIVNDPFLVWVHHFQSVRIDPEGEIEIHGSLLTPADRLHAPLLLHFDDQGRHRFIQGGGPLIKAIRFVDRDRPSFGLFSADCRGWGDSYPALFPFDTPSWAAIDRYLAYSTAALGDGIMQMRIRDGLECLQFIRRFEKTAQSPVVVCGAGLGGIVAAHVALLGEGIRALLLWEPLASIRDLVEAPHWNWSAEAFLPNILLHYDLPELLAALPCTVQCWNPLDPQKEPLDERGCQSLRESCGPHLHLHSGSPADLAAPLEQLLDACEPNLS